MPNNNKAEDTGATGTSAVQDAQAVAQPAVMEVPVDKMETILKTLEELQARDVKRDEEMAILRESVSRGKLDEAENKRKPKGPPRAKVMVHAGKIVTGWNIEKNELVYDPRNMMAPVSEDIQIRLKYHDGTDSGVMKYIDFVRNKVRADVNKVGENGIMWLIHFDDPTLSAQDMEIDPQFLNP